jgi:hypothetical protein
VADQRQDYSKGAKSDKVIHEGSLEMIKAGSSNSGNSGPTGSARDYAKKGKEGAAPHFKNWNPMSMKASTYGINGCEC